MKKNGYDQFFKAARTVRGPLKERRKIDPEMRIRQALKMRPTKKKKPFPVVPVATGLVLVGLSAIYFMQPDRVDRWAQRVQIRFMGQATAEEKAPEKAAAPAGDSEAKNSTSTTPGKTAEAATKDHPVSEDLGYIEKLRTRKEELDLREKELNQLEEELQRQKVEVDQRIRQLEQMRRDIASHLKERIEKDETQVNKLVDLYSNMKPKQAADVIGALQEDLAVEVLGKMKKKNAAEVMNLLPPEKARGLSEKLTGYKR